VTDLESPDRLTEAGFRFDGEVYCPWGDCTEPVHAQFAVNGTAYIGQFASKQSGPILIAGDLYHLPQEITMQRFPTFEFDKAQSAASRAKVEALVQQTGARLWIEHDLATFNLLKKAPGFYE